MDLVSARWRLALLLLGAFACLVTAQAESLATAVKAAYLSKFPLYVDWPAAVLSPSVHELHLCIAGPDPFGATLDAAVSGQRVAERPLVVRRLKTVTRDAGCHILFIGGSDGERAQALSSLRGSAVLTITDAPGAEAGVGIINFVVKDDRVRFDIDEAAAAASGIAISAKLLNLALNVRRRPGTEAH